MGARSVWSWVTAQGRLHAVAIGRFREAQLQGLLLGDEPGKPAGMSRPIAARQAQMVGDGGAVVAVSRRLEVAARKLSINFRAKPISCLDLRASKASSKADPKCTDSTLSLIASVDTE